MVAMLVLASCGTDSAPRADSGTVAQAPISGPDAQSEFEAGLVQGLVVPDPEVGEIVLLVVLVPGGGWATADPTGLIPLAEQLGGLGAAVSLITHRAGDDGVYFPDQPTDVACAINASAAAIRDAGLQIGDVIIVGHSSGAHLASLVALRPEAFSSACRYPLVTPDRLVGLAGPYDVTRAAPFAGDLFGPDNTDPADWTEGNPVVHADERPELEVLLVHGQEDFTVPIWLTEAFAAALKNGGHPLTVVRPEGVDHHSIYSPEIGGQLIAEWLNL